jgi:purine nucleoside phosphorylase
MPTDRSAVAVLLGSAYRLKRPGARAFEPVDVDTPYGTQRVWRAGADRPAYALFRHGLPHRLLPNQIDYRRQAAALAALSVGALLVTSSVGVMDAALPLFRPLLVGDLMMLDNRLPDGSTCTMFEQPSADHGHLVLGEGLFSAALGNQVERLAGEVGAPVAQRGVVFAYAGGPRGKTAAENRMWHLLGAQVNSMTLAPEVVLANELEIPCAGLVVGHKYSVPGVDNPHEGGVTETLDSSREAMERVVDAFLDHAEPVAFGNHLYRFDAS